MGKCRNVLLDVKGFIIKQVYLFRHIHASKLFSLTLLAKKQLDPALCQLWHL